MSQPRLLSIIMPCYNEARGVDRTLDALEQLRTRLAAQFVTVEIIAVDDGSKDGTAERLDARAATMQRLTVVRQPENRGKGAAIRAGREQVRGEFVVFQDADMELDPADIPRLIAPLLDGRADAVLGSRFARREEHQVRNYWHRLGNTALTTMSNVFTGLDLTDMETGYKAFTARAFKVMHMTSDRFGMEPEIVARLAQMRARVYEVPISYTGRTYAEGKKITWRDGVAVFWHILRAWASSGDQPKLTDA